MTTLDPRADVREGVRAFITESFLYLRPDLELHDSDDLLALGVIDSLGFVELVEFVEARLGAPTRDADITEDNFGSVDAIVAYLSRRAG